MWVWEGVCGSVGGQGYFLLNFEIAIEYPASLVFDLCVNFISFCLLDYDVDCELQLNSYSLRTQTKGYIYKVEMKKVCVYIHIYGSNVHMRSIQYWL